MAALLNGIHKLLGRKIHYFVGKVVVTSELTARNLVWNLDKHR